MNYQNYRNFLSNICIAITLACSAQCHAENRIQNKTKHSEELSVALTCSPLFTDSYTQKELNFCKAHIDAITEREHKEMRNIFHIDDLVIGTLKARGETYSKNTEQGCKNIYYSMKSENKTVIGLAIIASKYCSN